MTRKITRKIKSNSNREIEPLLPLNTKQSEYIKALYTHPIVIATGVLGSSKTYIPSVIACELLLEKKIDRVIIARPNSGVGKSIGHLPGTLEEKLAPWCEPIISVMKVRLGEGNYEAFVKNGKISMLALEHSRGRTFNDCFVIIDESQNLEQDVARSLVTRQGENCTVVITGDIAQKDIKNYSGLQLLLDVSKKYQLPVAHIDFNDWSYCVRSESAKMWGMSFEKHDRDPT